MSKYKWQGEPVKIRFGHVHLKENRERPLYWYNFECYIKIDINDNYIDNYGFLGTCFIPAIEVTCIDGYVFQLANHFGIGVHKLMNGGWPNYAHFSLDGKFEEMDWQMAIEYKKFDEPRYARHEAERRKWQKKNYPVEFEKMEQLKRLGKNILKQKEDKQ